MSKAWVSTSPTPKKNSGRDEKALGELHRISDVSDLDPKCRPEEETLRSRCLTGSDSRPRMPTELAEQ
jgi:hypothetical protein